MRYQSFIAVLVAGLAGCAVTDGNFGDTPLPMGCQGLSCQVPKCDSDRDTVLRGRVTAPNGNDSIRKAVVYIPESGQTLPLSPTLGCELCRSTFEGRTVAYSYTDINGRFELHGVPAGASIPVVIQKGRFRRLFQVAVQPCQTQDVAINGGNLVLPKNRQEGDLPQMAVAAGDHDAIECVLRDLGLDPKEFVVPDANMGPGGPNPAPASGAVHLYNNQKFGTPSFPGQLELPKLLSDRERLFRYNVVFLDCAETTYSSTLLTNEAVRNNLRDYVAAGGRLYVTDWSYDFIQQIPEFSPFVCFDDDQPCTITTPHGFHTAKDHGGTSDPLRATVEQTFPGGRALADWLGQLSPPVKPDNVPIQDLLPGWVMVRQTALDPIAHPSTVWLTATAKNLRRPLTLSIDYPPQAICGRVLFSSYHTRDRQQSGTFPAYCPATIGGAFVQERILEFLLFELGDCLGAAD